MLRLTAVCDFCDCRDQFLPRDAAQSAILPLQVVRLSVRPSVTLRYCDHIVWFSSKIISRLISPGFSLFADSNIVDLFKESIPNLAGIVVGYGWRLRPQSFASTRLWVSSGGRRQGIIHRWRRDGTRYLGLGTLSSPMTILNHAICRAGSRFSSR